MDRCSDKLPDRYSYRRLQDAAQGRDESAEELGGRCRKLCRRTVWKFQVEVQRIINVDVECLLAVCIHGRRVVVGQQAEEAMRLASAVETAEKHKQRWSEVRGRCWPT